MTDLTLLPAELAELSVAQLASLSPQQKILLARQLEQAGDWLKQVKARLDAALEQTYGDRIRVARSDGQQPICSELHSIDSRSWRCVQPRRPDAAS